jgi:hypothetical protein
MKTSIEQHLSIIAAREQLPSASAVAPTAADPYVEGSASGSTGPAMEQIEHYTSRALDASDDVIMVLVDTFFHCCHNQPYSFNTWPKETSRRTFYWLSWPVPYAFVRILNFLTVRLRHLWHTPTELGDSSYPTV